MLGYKKQNKRGRGAAGRDRRNPKRNVTRVKTPNTKDNVTYLRHCKFVTMVTGDWAVMATLPLPPFFGAVSLGDWDRGAKEAL